MKYIIVLGDGMADEPIEKLSGKTPLEAADKPTMDRLAKKGEVGLAYMVPEGMSPGSDTANLSCIGLQSERILYGTFSTRSVKHRCGYETDRCGTAL